MVAFSVLVRGNIEGQMEFTSEVVEGQCPF